MKTFWPVTLIAALALCLSIALSLQIGKAQDTDAKNATSYRSLPMKRSATRTSPSDLELGGDVYGLLPGAARNIGYLTREQLLSLPQVSYTVTNDANFSEPAEISGVALEQLIQSLPGKPHSEMIVAICRDEYEAYFPRAYIAAHHPVLVLKINGKDPAGWPKTPDGGAYMGPYLISSPDFKPSFKILSHEDEPQIPWGVRRLEIRTEAGVFHAIQPRMPGSVSPEVQDGYRIAQQNCFRCHNSELEGGMKAKRGWTVLATWATASPDYFAAYIHDPRSKNPGSQMPGFPNYDEATLHALTKYFQTFADAEKREKP